jgi:hypothetical protein
MQLKFGAQHQYTAANGDTLYVRVTDFEILGALETDDCCFYIQFEVLGFTNSDGQDVEGDYPHMTDDLSYAIQDHIGPEHYTLYIGSDDEY